MDLASSIRLVYPGRGSHLATLGRSSLGPIGSFIAALCWLTNLGLIEKGRMIEIEAIYCSLFAFALILWLVFWEQSAHPGLPSSCPGSSLA